MKQLLLAVVLVVAAITVASPAAAGKKGSGTASPGTGSKSSSTYVKSHIKKDGTFVEGHRRSSSDQKFENNWTTKGNENLYSGKDGTRLTPSEKR